MKITCVILFIFFSVINCGTIYIWRGYFSNPTCIGQPDSVAGTFETTNSCSKTQTNCVTTEYANTFYTEKCIEYSDFFVNYDDSTVLPPFAGTYIEVRTKSKYYSSPCAGGSISAHYKFAYFKNNSCTRLEHYTGVWYKSSIINGVANLYYYSDSDIDCSNNYLGNTPGYITPPYNNTYCSSTTYVPGNIFQFVTVVESTNNKLIGFIIFVFSAFILCCCAILFSYCSLCLFIGRVLSNKQCTTTNYYSENIQYQYANDYSSKAATVPYYNSVY